MPFSLRRALATLAVVVAVALGWWWHGRDGRDGRAPRAPAAVPAAVVPLRAVPASNSTTSAQATVPPRSNFISALAPFRLPAELAHAWVSVARPTYNLGEVQAGHILTLLRSAEGVPKALSYQIDGNHWLWLRARPAAPDKPAAPAWSATIETVPYELRLVGVSGTVESSLFGAVERAGESDELALDLNDIFGWDLDFYTDPRQGDTFRVLVEKRYLDGKFAGYGQVVAAEYVNHGKAYEALRFHDDMGLLAYYRPDGVPMKRAFLRSPLKFAARISSGFSEHRYHPILKIYRPHLGTDFAAPIGTPVQTIGAGVVTRAGRAGEDGNMVQIRHSGGYQTLYLHLSRILVHIGERVSQGERIGLVGMTGLATGPHLDFRIEHDGTFENFEVLRKKLPPADPVSRGLFPQFQHLRARYIPELNALEPAPQPAAAAPPPGPAAAKAHRRPRP